MGNQMDLSRVPPGQLVPGRMIIYGDQLLVVRSVDQPPAVYDKSQEYDGHTYYFDLAARICKDYPNCDCKRSDIAGSYQTRFKSKFKRNKNIFSTADGTPPDPAGVYSE
jgi:hypothetical protein